MPPALTRTTSSTSTSGSTTQQATTSQESIQSTITSATTTARFVPSPETIDATNSTLGLQLSLSVNSTVIPSEDGIQVNSTIFNTLSKENNLTASSDWPIQGLSDSGHLCPVTNSDAFPVGLEFFAGDYGINNVSSAIPLVVWMTIPIECPVQTPENWTYFSFLPKNSSAYIGGFSPNLPKTLSTLALVWAADSTTIGRAFNSLNSSLAGIYTIAAGDEWGQLALLHFQVIASNNLPIVGTFLGPGQSLAMTLSEAIVFNCLSQASTSSGCNFVSSAGFPTTAFYPYVNQPNETVGANCMAQTPVTEISNHPYYGDCILINSTAFVLRLL